MRFSFGRGKYGPVTETTTASWSEFCGLLRDACDIPRAVADKDDAYWVAPFLLAPDATRRTIDEVATMGGWLAFDLDTGNWSLDAIASRLMFTSRAIYSTASSQPDEQRWRIMLLADREYTPQEHPRIWRWYNSRFDGQLDAATRNANRLFYVPSAWDGSPPSYAVSYGRPVNIDGVLSLSPECDADRPCVPIQTALKEAPNGQPIISKYMIEKAQTSPVGRRLFRLMCAAAKVFRLQGWTLNEHDLADAALVASQQFSPGKPRPNIRHEARNAIQWAARSFQPQTPLERMRGRLLFQQEKTEARRMENFRASL